MASSKFSFKNLFRGKKKDEDEVQDFMRQHEKMRSKDKKKNNEEDELYGIMKRLDSRNKKRPQDPLDINATSCYHTEVAPKTRRGPKSMPGGMMDNDYGGGHVNRSFETEIPSRPRRRAPSPDNYKENRRRQRTAFSEFNGPAVGGRRTDLDYRSVVIEESDEENDRVRDLKGEVQELKRKLNHAQARRQTHKIDLDEANDMRKRQDKAYKSQEDKYQREIMDLKRDNDMLKASIANLQQQLQQEQRRHCHCQRTPMYPSYPSNFPLMFPPTMPAAASVSSRDSLVADPQPTLKSFVAPFPQQNDFAREDRDETKVFAMQQDSITDYDVSDLSHTMEIE